MSRAFLTACAVLALSAHGEAAPPPGPAPEHRAAAASRFEAGKKLVRAGAWAAALAEFLESRRRYPTWSATFNAAICLQELGRHAEALDAYEAVLREFPDKLPAATKDTVQRAVLTLRGRVGTIALDESEPGAVISVDGVVHGEHPLVAPLRVATGSHVVRVYKEGFEPFEVRLDVAARQTAHVQARLHAVVRGGRLRVAEQAGREVQVLVDNNVVGQAPWEGPVAAGEHLVALRGDGMIGAQPVTVTVLRDKPRPSRSPQRRWPQPSGSSPYPPTPPSRSTRWRSGTGSGRAACGPASTPWSSLRRASCRSSRS